MKGKSKYILILVLILGVSCDLDQLDNPNNLTSSQADLSYVLNSVQLGVKDFFKNSSEYGMRNTRMTALIGGSTYASAYQATSFDNIWSNAYSSVLINAKLVIDQADAKKWYLHAAVAKILRAYTLVSLVDMFGDVPNSQALDSKNFNPKADKGADVYADALASIEAALTDLQSADANGAPGIIDLFYDGTTTNWKALANTLKLKIYLQTRLVDTNAASKITALLSSDAPLIDEDVMDAGDAKGEDFEFDFPANSPSAPDTRHSWFVENYLNGASEYMSNQYMYEMLRRDDPRVRYYFYRQTLAPVTDVNAAPCAQQTKPAWYTSDVPFCQLGAGYIGRDHLNNDGIPPDTKLRTIYGIYPAGGKYDNDNGVPGAITDGKKGVGIYPFILSSFVDFMQAEAAFVLGTPGDPKALMLSGVEKSLHKVAKQSGISMTDADVTAYLNQIATEYDDASDKLDVIIRQYWFAAFGNGIEAYNAYRRTGKPTNMQPARKVQDPGAYYRSFIYPAVFVNRNSSQGQKSQADPVFWDTNPAGFVN
jgi:hypothetical protein